MLAYQLLIQNGKHEKTKVWSWHSSWSAMQASYKVIHIIVSCLLKTENQLILVFTVWAAILRSDILDTTELNYNWILFVSMCMLVGKVCNCWSFHLVCNLSYDRQKSLHFPCIHLDYPSPVSLCSVVISCN